MIRLLHLADLHLGWEASYLSDSKKNIRRKERDSLLKKAVDFALLPSNKIDGILIVGDLFEKYNPEKELVENVIKDLNRVSSEGLMLVTVPGNHDEITYRESVYRVYENEWPGYLIKEPMPKHCLTHRIKDYPVYIYSLAYTGGVTKVNRIDSFPRETGEGFHIGAFHGSLDWEGLSDRSLPLTSEKLSDAGYDYIALGHYHQHSVKSIGKGLAVYPGAIEFKSFKDRGTGEFTIVSFDGKRASIENVKADVRDHETLQIDVSIFKDYEELLSFCLEKSDIEKIIEVNLSGSPKFQIDEEKLKGDLEGAFFYPDIKNTARHFSDSYLKTISKEPTLRGAYVSKMQELLSEAEGEEEKTLIEQALLEGLMALEGSER